MRKLVKINGIWRLSFSGKEERRFCAVCNHVGYNLKDFFSHRDTHTFEEHDMALCRSIIAEKRWKLMKDCPK
jgi:hypothetical protein